MWSRSTGAVSIGRSTSTIAVSCFGPSPCDMARVPDTSGPTGGGDPLTPAEALVVIPTYNAQDNIESLLAAVLAHRGFAVLVVDDSSPDGTAEIVAQVARCDPRVSLLRRRARMGMGSAY